MIHIRLESPNQVIKSINVTQLPDFCVIIGKNGSGKTKFLESIQSGNIIASNSASGQRLSSTYFNYNDFTTKDPKVYGKNNQPKNLNTFVDNGDMSRFTNELSTVLKAGSSSIKIDLETVFTQNSFYSKYTSDSSVLKKSNFKLNRNEKEIFRRIRKTVFSIGEFDFYYNLSKDMNINLRSLSGLKNDNNYLGKRIRDLFIEYSIKLTEFKHSQLNKPDEYQKNLEKFIEKNGNAPWDELNIALNEYPANSYLFDTELYEKPAQFGVKREDISMPIQVRNGESVVLVDQLSSGEKTLLALAVVVYEQGKIRQGNLLLLDEVDSSLHPSMIKQLLSGIRTSFIERGYRVIFVTHSPSTTAFSREGSLYELRKVDGSKHEIREIKRNAGLEILTSGFMTLDEGLVAIKSHKPLVFVEGPTDIQYIKDAAAKLAKQALLDSIDIRIVGSETDQGTADSDEKNLKQFAKTLSHHDSLLEHKVLFIHDPETQNYTINRTSSKIRRLFLKKNTENKIQRGIEALLEKNTIDEAIEKFPESFKKEIIGSDTKKIHIHGDKTEIANFVRSKNESYAFFNEIFVKIEELLK